MASVVEQSAIFGNGIASASPSIVATPGPGDYVFVSILSARSAGGRTVTAISGLGATWAEVHNSGASRYIVYRGTGATSSGAVSITFSGTHDVTILTSLLRGLSATTIAASFTTGAGLTFDGPSQAAGSGQVVLAVAVSGSAITFPSATIPTSGWSSIPTSNGGGASAAPSSTATHMASASKSSSVTFYIGQAVVGDVGVPQATAATSVGVVGAASAIPTVPASSTVAVNSVASAFQVGAAIPTTASTVVAVNSFADAAEVVVVDPSPTALTREGGRSRGGSAFASWEPAVVQPPALAGAGAILEHRHIRAAAFGYPTSDFPVTYTESEATAPRHRTRIMVGGKDVSFFRGVPTPEPEYQLAEPLRWGPSSVEFPQIAAAFFDPADYPWLAKGKPVTYQRVDAAGNKLAIDYRGVVVAYDTSGKTLRLEVGGHAQGRAALRRKPLPIFKDTLDLGRLAWAAIRDLGLAFSPRLGPTTGIKQALFGGSDHLAHISELCAKAFDFDGQWTLMPDDAGRYTFARKDRTTVHWTLFNDDARTVADLRSDAAEEPNRIFATGVTPKGQRVRFGVYPGLKPGPAAPYPFTDDRNFGQWTTDAETDTGDGITVMVRKLWTAGFLSLEEIPGDYDADVTRAIMALQDQAGRPITGNMNPATWAALFDLDATGYSLRGSRIEPAAQDYRVRRYDRSSSDAIIGKNPNFDPNRLIVDREIDFGSGFTRQQMRDMARAEVYRGEDNWFGTITINGGAILRGDVAPGATIAEADLADVRDIQPGENVRLPLFGGGILLHVSGVEVTRGQDGHPIARLTVDTQARDAMPVWEMIRRNRETRRDPARRWKGNRASGQVKDSITEWDEVGGVLYGDRELVPGWNVVEVVGGQEGTVSRLRLNVHDADGDGVEFACSITGKQVTAARMNTLISAPLSTGGHKAWENGDVRAVLKKKWHLYSAGTNEEPCGYSPGRKSDSDPLRGIHEDDAGFSYRTDRQPVLYLAVYVRSAAVLEGGRVMWNQLEAGA